MRHLLPPRFAEWSELGTTEHTSPGAILLLDAEDSTALSARLRSHGILGAEALSALLTQIFAPVVDIVTATGGYVAHFTGDGMIAVYPGEPTDVVRRAVRSGLAILDHLDRVSGVETTSGPVDLAVRAIVGAGTIETHVWRSAAVSDVARQNAAYIVVGSALHEAQSGEETVHGGTLGLGPNAAAAIPDLVAPPLVAGYVAVDRDLEIPPSVHPKGVSVAPTTHDARGRSDLDRWRFVIPEAFDPRVAPEFRHVMVMFMELRDWPTDETMSDVIELAGATGGHIGSLIRDGPGQLGLTVLLLWGAPNIHDDDPKRALRFVESLTLELGAGQFRAGAVYTDMFSGFVGSELHSTYTVVGAPVNLAARLCSLAAWGETRVTATLDPFVPVDWHVEPVAATVYRGFTHPLPTFSIRPNTSL